MKHTIVLLLLISISTLGHSQKRSRFSIEANYGLTGNFVVRAYDEVYSPLNEVLLLNKDFLGSIGGIEVRYQVGNRSKVGLGYARSINKGKKNFEGTLNGVDIEITDFKLRHVTEIFEFIYERDFSRNNLSWDYEVGLFVLKTHQQEVQIGPGGPFSPPYVVFDERNAKNSGLTEGGAFAGIHFSRPIDTKFRLGLRARAYFTISTGRFEVLGLTPTLSYNF